MSGFLVLKGNLFIWLSMNVYGGLKWMLWLMCNCDFLGKGEKDYWTGTGTQREASGIER